MIRECNQLLQVMIEARPSGRPSRIEKYYKLQCLRFRDKLRLSIRDHGMHRSRKEEWDTNVNTHVVRNKRTKLILTGYTIVY